jgi:DNA-binding NtrC family response regulator
LLSAERSVILKSDVYDDFFSDADPLQEDASATANPKLSTIDDMERHMILEALKETGNNQQAAADKLGISARTIRNKLRKYRDEGATD